VTGDRAELSVFSEGDRLVGRNVRISPKATSYFEGDKFSGVAQSSLSFFDRITGLRRIDGMEQPIFTTEFTEDTVVSDCGLTLGHACARR
jgi:hypothetical protein